MAQTQQTEEKKLTLVRQFDLTKVTINNLYKFKLTPNTRIVLMYLTTCYNPSHKDVFPKQSTMASCLDMSEASVIRAIKELLKEGLILVVPGHRNRYVFTNKLFSLCDNKLQPSTLQNESNLPCKLQPTIHEQTIEHDKEQHVEVQKEEKKDTVLSIDDFNLLKDYAAKKGIANSVAYAKAIIKNGGAEDLLNKLKEQERITEAAKRREIETRKRLDVWEEHCRTCPSTFGELSKETQEKIKAIKQKLGIKTKYDF